MRWAPLTLVEDDPPKLDVDFWLDYVRRTHADGAWLSAGGCVAYYRTEVPFHHRSAWLATATCAVSWWPGAAGSAWSSGLPAEREVNAFGTDIEGYTPPPGAPPDWVDYYQTVSLGCFQAIGVPIVRGRAFERADLVSGPVAVVNEAFARRFWKGLDPIGRRVKPRFGDQVPWVTVVGVAKDVKQSGVDQAAGTELYFLLDQLPRIFQAIPGRGVGPFRNEGTMHVVLRGTVLLAALQPAIADAVREADPSLVPAGPRARRSFPPSTRTTNWCPEPLNCSREPMNCWRTPMRLVRLPGSHFIFLSTEADVVARCGGSSVGCVTLAQLGVDRAGHARGPPTSTSGRAAMPRSA